MWNSQIFWFGDLNYRLCLEDSFARQLIKKQDWKALQEFDQLRREQKDARVFQGWQEGDIDFAPTYKYSSSNHNRYSGGLPSKAGEKQRTPAWYNYQSNKSGETIFFSVTTYHVSNCQNFCIPNIALINHSFCLKF